MKIGIYAMKDNVTGFAQPSFFAYEAQATRDFAYGVNQPGLVNFRPEDYSLWYVGTFDSDTGVVESVDPKLLVHATEVVK